MIDDFIIVGGERLRGIQFYTSSGPTSRGNIPNSQKIIPKKRTDSVFSYGPGLRGFKQYNLSNKKRLKEMKIYNIINSNELKF